MDLLSVEDIILEVPTNREPEEMEINMVNTLIKSALGFHEDEVTIIDGVGSNQKEYHYKKTVTNYYPPCLEAIIFLLNNMDYVNWIYGTNY